MVARFEPGSFILDVPLGTGRLIPFYREGNHPVLGIDISTDMLREAREKHVCRDSPNNLSFLVGDAENLPLADQSVDYLVCIRLFNWLPKSVCEKVINEFCRVTRKGIVIGFRSREPLPLKDFLFTSIKEYIHLHQWVATWIRGVILFTRRMAGQVKRIVRKFFFPQKLVKPIFFSGQTFYNKGKMRKNLNMKNWQISREIPIDSIREAKKKRCLTYSIYFIEARILKKNTQDKSES